MDESEQEELKSLIKKFPELEAIWSEELALNALLRRATVAGPSEELADLVMDEIRKSDSSGSASNHWISEIGRGFLSAVRRPVVASLVSVGFVTAGVIGFIIIPGSETDYRWNSNEIESAASMIPGIDEIMPSGIWNIQTLEDFPAIVYSAEVESMIDKELLVAMQQAHY